MECCTPSSNNKPQAPLDAACCGVEAGVSPEPRSWSRQVLVFGVALVLAGQSMVLGLGLNLADPPLSPDSAVYWALHGGLLLIALLVFGLLGGPLLRSFGKAVRERRITVEALFLLSIFGALVGSLLTTFAGEGAVYYEVVVIVLSVYALGSLLTMRSRDKAREAVAKVEQVFDSAMIEGCCGNRMPVAVADLQPEDRVIVEPGEAIPVDGEILTGSGAVQETALTGEPRPALRTAGDAVFAGSYSVDARLVLRSTAAKGARKLDRLLRAVSEARLRPSRIQAQADRLMEVFVPVVVAVSLLTFVVWCFFAPWYVALFNSMAVLLVACPCALGLALPIGLWSGLFRLSQLGIVARSADFIDVVGRARHIVFDKTGTLSESSLRLQKAEVDASALASCGLDEGALRDAIRRLEEGQRHPVARALLADWAAASRCTEEAAFDWRVTATSILPGQGIAGEFAHSSEGRGFELQLLNAAADREGWDLTARVNGQTVARFAFSEALRPHVAEDVRRLSDLGLKVTVLTGDPAPQWQEIGGVTLNVGLSPEDKLQWVREREAAGEPVLFIGDGINDSAAMAESSASLAMQEGADLARASAVGVWTAPHFSSLPDAVSVCRRIRGALRGNMRFAVFYNLVGMALAAAGLLHPVVAALIMVVSSVLVSWRASRSALGALHSEAPSSSPGESIPSRKVPDPAIG